MGLMLYHKRSPLDDAYKQGKQWYNQRKKVCIYIYIIVYKPNLIQTRIAENCYILLYLFS